MCFWFSLAMEVLISFSSVSFRSKIKACLLEASSLQLLLESSSVWSPKTCMSLSLGTSAEIASFFWGVLLLQVSLLEYDVKKCQARCFSLFLALTFSWPIWKIYTFFAPTNYGGIKVPFHCSIMTETGLWVAVISFSVSVLSVFIFDLSNSR